MTDPVTEAMVALVTAAATAQHDDADDLMAAVLGDLSRWEPHVVFFLLCQMAGLTVALIERDAEHSGVPFDVALRGWALSIAGDDV